MFTLSKHRTIGFIVLSLVMIIMFWMMSMVPEQESFSIGTMLLMSAAIPAAFFMLMKFLDHDDKMKKYEKEGYIKLKEDDEKIVMARKFNRSGVFKDDRIAIAVFDKKGFLKHHVYLNCEDISNANEYINQKEL